MLSGPAYAVRTRLCCQDPLVVRPLLFWTIAFVVTIRFRNFLIWTYLFYIRIHLYFALKMYINPPSPHCSEFFYFLRVTRLVNTL